MRIRPRLFDWDNLGGPQWVQPELSNSELDELSQATVMFVGHDPATPDRVEVLGSGFIVGVADTLIVATASHIFSWWVDRLEPPPRYMVPAIAGDRDDFNRRLQKVILSHRIVACVNSKRALTGLILPIVGLAINSNPRDLDLGFVQLAIPRSSDRSQFTVLPIDADDFSFREPVLMAGYVGGGRQLAIGEHPYDPGFYEQKIAVRAGRVGELVTQPDGHRTPMYRVNIPSLPGMSGGPLLKLRPLRDSALSVVTAVGAISSSRLGSPILLDHCSEGETWVAPIIIGLGRKLNINGRPTTISDAIQSGTIESYGGRAREFEFLRDESAGLAATSFRKRAKQTP